MAGPLSDLSRRLADFDQRRPVTAGIILILIITVAVFSGAYRRPIAPPPGCVTSLLVAHNLAEKNVFSIEVTAPDTRPASGRPMPPAYPFLLAGLARIDPGVARGLDCAGLSPSQHQLGRYFESLRFLQALAGVGILILVYHLAEALTGARSMAMATVVLYVIGGKLGEFARSVEPDNFRNLATFLSLLLLSIAYRKEQGWMFGAAGACLGVAALFHPILGILIFALPAVLAAIPWITGSGRSGGRRNALYNVAFVLGGLAVIGPWCARNLYLFGDPMLADRSEALLLSFRVAYNAMPYSDWPLAVLSWVPSYGNVLTQFFFGADAAHRFALLEPGAYFANGPAILAEGIDKTPTTGNPFFVVCSTYVAADPIPSPHVNSGLCPRHVGHAWVHGDRWLVLAAADAAASVCRAQPAGRDRSRRVCISLGPHPVLPHPQLLLDEHPCASHDVSGYRRCPSRGRALDRSKPRRAHLAQPS
jgi:hypothetical protein